MSRIRARGFAGKAQAQGWLWQRTPEPEQSGMVAVWALQRFPLYYMYVPKNEREWFLPPKMIFSFLVAISIPIFLTCPTVTTICAVGGQHGFVPLESTPRWVGKGRENLWGSSICMERPRTCEPDRYLPIPEEMPRQQCGSGTCRATDLSRQAFSH